MNCNGFGQPLARVATLLAASLALGASPLQAAVPATPSILSVSRTQSYAVITIAPLTGATDVTIHGATDPNFTQGVVPGGGAYTGTSYTVYVPCVPYYFRVKASNAEGISAWSPSALSSCTSNVTPTKTPTKVPPTLTPTPAPPTAVPTLVPTATPTPTITPTFTATPKPTAAALPVAPVLSMTGRTWNGATLAWTVPPGEVLGYYMISSSVNTFPIGSSTGTSSLFPQTTTVSQSFPCSANGFYFKVAAWNSRGTGPYSSVLYTGACPCNPTTPPPPTNLTIAKVGTTCSGADLKWTPPVMPAGCPAITSYTVITYDGQYGAGTATTARVAAPAGQQLSWRVSASNSLGTSAPSAPLTWACQ